MPEEEGTFDSVSAHLVGHCCQHFGLGWRPNRIKGGLRRGKCQRNKQALQLLLGQLQRNDADVVVYKASKTPRPCCRAVERACFRCAQTVALVTSLNMAGGACKWGLAHLCIVASLIGVTATRLFCLLVFPSVGQDLRNNQTKAGYPEGFDRAFQPFVLLSSTYLRLGRTCKSPLSKQASRQEPINYM